MTFYEVIKFLHIAAAAMWIGAGMLMIVLAVRADRAKDDASMVKVLKDAGGLANIYFIPASLAVFVFGLIMTIDAWAFDQLWIVLGLIGYLSTFITGAAVIGPRAEKLGKRMAEAGVGAAEVLEARKIRTISRIDYVVLFTLTRYRSVEAGQAAPATAT